MRAIRARPHHADRFVAARRSSSLRCSATLTASPAGAKLARSDLRRQVPVQAYESTPAAVGRSTSGARSAPIARLHRKRALRRFGVVLPETARRLRGWIGAGDTLARIARRRNPAVRRGVLLATHATPRSRCTQPSSSNVRGFGARDPRRPHPAGSRRPRRDGEPGCGDQTAHDRLLLTWSYDHMPPRDRERPDNLAPISLARGARRTLQPASESHVLPASRCALRCP
jgi:hypothetical protein